MMPAARSSIMSQLWGVIERFGCGGEQWMTNGFSDETQDVSITFSPPSLTAPNFCLTDRRCVSVHHLFLKSCIIHSTTPLHLLTAVLVSMSPCWWSVDDYGLKT